MLEKVSKIISAFTDERGEIKNILENPINHVAIITSKAGSIRGNHYHPNDTQYCYLINGKFESHAKDINNDKLEKIHSELIQYSRSKWNKGCDIVIMGHYHHSFNFTENQKQLIILDDCCNQQFNYAKYDGNSISIKSL